MKKLFIILLFVILSSSMTATDHYSLSGSKKDADSTTLIIGVSTLASFSLPIFQAEFEAELFFNNIGVRSFYRLDNYFLEKNIYGVGVIYSFQLPPLQNEISILDLYLNYLVNGGQNIFHKELSTTDAFSGEIIFRNELVPRLWIGAGMGFIQMNSGLTNLTFRFGIQLCIF